jgi:hypothetical protein
MKAPQSASHGCCQGKSSKTVTWSAWLQDCHLLISGSLPVFIARDAQLATQCRAAESEGAAIVARYPSVVEWL